MKRNLFLLLIVLSITALAVVPAFAQEDSYAITETVWEEDGTVHMLYEDGSMLTLSPIQTGENSISTYATAKTITADRVASFTDGDGKLCWEYTLYGTFSYVYGTSSTCTKASYTQNIYDSGWDFSNGSATKSGNKAIGKGTFKKSFLFVTIKTYDIDISLTCDIYGNVT